MNAWREFRSMNPANESLIGRWSVHSAEDVEARIARAHDRFVQTLEEPRAHRLALLGRIADLLDQQREKLAQTATLEMGKPIREARAEIAKCALVCRHYQQHADEYLLQQTIKGAGYITYEPIGPILAIMPWNFPFWQVIRVLAPAIALGNPLLLKHAENVTGCALAIEQLMTQADAPAGTLQTLLIETARVDAVIADMRVAGVTLTGSEAAGSAVAASAGRAIKPVVLELGGSDPFVILRDANLDEAVKNAVHARMQNSGQSCIAGKRFIIEAPIYDVFVRRFAEQIQQLVCDDPSFDSTNVGPIARPDLLERVEEQVRESVGYGARLVCGGQRLHERGNYYAPTLLAEVEPHHRAFREEVFGPVAAVSIAQDIDHAIALANQTTYGLGASIWTQRDDAHALAQRLRAGTVGVNRVVHSDPALPFGGTKRSGFGRELGQPGILAFANIKTVLGSR